MPSTLTFLVLLALLTTAPPSETAVLNETLRQTLIDADRNLRIAVWSVSSKDLTPGATLHWRVEKDVLHGGRQEGVDRIRVQSGDLSFTVIPTRGMNLWEARAGDVRLGWDSPVKEVVHPQFVSLTERGGLGWLEGFGEWLNRCGLASNGLPGMDEVKSNTGALVPVSLTLHGKVSYLPARRVEVVIEPGTNGTGIIKIRGIVDETMMYGTQLRLVTEILTVVGSKTIYINDEIQNLAATDQEFQILYHTNFGPPLLGDGAEVVAPALRVTPRDTRAAESGLAAWNRYGPPTAGYVEQVYFLQLAADARGETEVLLKNPAGDRGATLAFSTRELPHLTIWKNTSAFENGYVTGIEPATNFPNNRRFERQNGRVPVLKGGTSWRARLRVTALLSREEVGEAAKRIEKLLDGRKTQVDAGPVAGLCP